jgi:molecular chaperone GrpE
MTSSSNGEKQSEHNGAHDDMQEATIDDQVQQFPSDNEMSEEGNPEVVKSIEPDFRDSYVRLLADFDNYKKRAAKERADLIKYQGEQIFIDLLDVVDNFDRALEHSSAEVSQLREGIEMIHQSLLSVLSKWGVKGESGIGAPFDPNKQSALSQVPSPDVIPGHVVNELKKAYFYKDKLIRPGEVVVAKE